MKNFWAATLVFAISASCATSAFAGAPTGSKTFQGEVFIETVSDTCTSLSDAAIGDFYRVVYLYQGTSTHVEGLSFVGARGVFLIQPSGSLNGSTSTTGTGINSHAILYTQTGSSNLTISSVGGASTADAMNLKIVGTINNFYDAGCNVTVRADLVARPN